MLFPVNKVDNCQIMKFLIVDRGFHQDSKQFSSHACHIMCLNSIFFTLIQITGLSIIQIIPLDTDSEYLKVRGALPSNEIKYSKFDLQVQLVRWCPMLCGYCSQSSRVKNPYLRQHHSVIYSWYGILFNKSFVLCISLKLYLYGNVIHRLYWQSPFKTGAVILNHCFVCWKTI